MAEAMSETMKFTYPVSQDVSLVTIVPDPVHNQAVVQIVGCGLTFWSVELMPVAPVAQLQMDLTTCNGTVIEKGSKFTLILTENGQVLFEGKVQTGSQPPMPINAIIATWPLNSAG